MREKPPANGLTGVDWEVDAFRRLGPARGRATHGDEGTSHIALSTYGRVETKRAEVPRPYELITRVHLLSVNWLP